MMMRYFDKRIKPLYILFYANIIYYVEAVKTITQFFPGEL